MGISLLGVFFLLPSRQQLRAPLVFFFSVVVAAYFTSGLLSFCRCVGCWRTRAAQKRAFCSIRLGELAGLETVAPDLVACNKVARSRIFRPGAARESPHQRARMGRLSRALPMWIIANQCGRTARPSESVVAVSMRHLLSPRSACVS